MRWILGLIVVVVVGLLTWLVIYEVTRPPVVGTVTDKSIREAYTTTSYVRIGEVNIPQTNYHPKSWYLFVEDKEGDIHKIRVTEGIYDRAKKGDYFDEEKPQNVGQKPQPKTL
jgi:hypothetical protein